MHKSLGMSVAAAAAALALSCGSASAATSCSLYASPSGSDGAAGTAAAPFQTVQKLVGTLASGQTGCVEPGSYTEDVTFRTPGITLTADSSQAATIHGRLWVAASASGVTVSNLKLDGVNAQGLPSPTIDANQVTFANNDVTNEHTAICFDVGNLDWGIATGTLITGNRIHDCGKLPALNHDHGIYVEAAVDTQIAWNLIYNNSDRGVQMYPDAQNTTIDHNIITGNGEGIIFSGDFGYASSGANVYDNVIANSVLRHDVESWYPAGNPIGTNNSVHDNCVWGGASPSIDTSGGGFAPSGNITADPGYANAGAADFTLSSASPCLALVGDVAGVVNGTASPTTAGDTTGVDTTGGGSTSTGGAGATSPSPSPPAGSTTKPVKKSGHHNPVARIALSGKTHRATVHGRTRARRGTRRHHTSSRSARRPHRGVHSQHRQAGAHRARPAASRSR